LDEIIRNEHIAGNNINHIQFFARDIASSLKHIHSANAIHADFKPRNIVRLHGKYILIDFDSCTAINEAYSSEKISSAFVPPELARIKFRPKKSLQSLRVSRDSLKKKRRTLLLNDADSDEDEIDSLGRQIKSLTNQILQLEEERENGKTGKVKAIPTYDVWSFGCVMYCMLTKGLDLFKKDQVDNIVETEDKLRLVQWKGLSSVELSRVLPSCNDSVEVDSAKDLLKMCLHPDPAKRFQSMDQVLNHKFLKKNDESRVYNALQTIRKEQSFKHVQLMSAMDENTEMLKTIDRRITASALKISRLIGSQEQLTCPNLVLLEKVRRRIKVPRLHRAYDLFFVCAHSGEKLEKHPIRVVVKETWLKKVLPFLKAAHFAIKITGIASGIPIPDFPYSETVTELFEEELLPATLDKMNESDELPDMKLNTRQRQAIKLVGEGYKLIAEKANEKSDWTSDMQRVNNDERTIWVKNEYAMQYQVP